ncbi:hypothetical protein CYY_001398 [Polysphondylium violaceum]|uniref:Uncharacterized protein n=1 Tax=Polysphondylium violaceum TaxID=133409 RepID=A0A8J4Q3A7_9MYCE|nr:hypothetical protein CYY_001398 [Polysphondylium violaceum]
MFKYLIKKNFNNSTIYINHCCAVKSSCLRRSYSGSSKVVFKGIQTSRDDIKHLKDNEIVQLIREFTNDTKKTLADNPDIVNQLSKSINLPRDEIIQMSPFSLRSAIVASNQGVSFYHQETRRHITPRDDYERQKRIDLIEKINKQELENELKKQQQQNKKDSNNVDSNKKKSISLERELQIQMEQKQEQQHFDQVMEEATQWSLGRLSIQESINYLFDDLYASYNPNEPISSVNHQIIQRLSKFYYNENAGKWEMFKGTKISQSLALLSNNILNNLYTIENNQHIDNNQLSPLLKNSITFFENELNLSNMDIIKLLNGQEIQQLQTTNLISNDIIQQSNIDILNYIKQHTSRLLSTPFNNVFQSFKVNQDYFNDIDKYQQYILDLFDQLLFKDISLNVNNQQEKEQKFKLDLIHREALRQYLVYNYYGTCPEPEKHQETDTRRLGHLIKTLSKKSSDEYFVEVKKYLNSNILENGIASNSNIVNNTTSIDQIKDGLYSSVSSTIGLLDFIIQHKLMPNQLSKFNDLDSLFKDFSLSKYMFNRSLISTRFQEYLINQIQLPPLFKQIIELEEKILQLMENDDGNDDWIGELSIELDQVLQPNETDQFIIIPSPSYQLYKTSNHHLLELHKTFSEDIDAKIQEMAIFNKNKKLYERQVKELNDQLIKLITNANENDQQQEQFLMFVGMFEGEVYTLEISKEWESIWNNLLKHRNGISLDQFIQEQGFSDKQIKNLLTTLLDLNKLGVIGLLPK